MPESCHRFDNAKRRRHDNHYRQRILTPPYILEPIRELLSQIDLDPCTEPDNPTRAEAWYCLPDDGCELPWVGKTVFCNPPYGEAKDRWIERCILESEKNKMKIVLLIPSHTETKMFQKALQYSQSVLFVRSRIRFGTLRPNRRQEAASHGSAVLGFNVDLRPLSHLGTVMVPA